MKVQKKTKAMLLLLLPLWAWTTHCFAQLNLNSPPNDYNSAIQIMYDVYGDDIQVSIGDVQYFMNKAVSNLPYDSNWATPDAQLIYRSQGQFGLNWDLLNKADNYRISTLDLGNNAKSFTNASAPPYQGNFANTTGPTLIVVQAEDWSLRSSTLDFIIIDKIIMLIDFDYDCDCPGYQFIPVTNTIGHPDYLFPLHGYPLTEDCPQTVYMLNVELQMGDESTFYNVFWEMDFLTNNISLGALGCGESLAPNLLAPDDYPESLVSADGALLIHMDNNQVTASANGDGVVLNTSLFTCCNKNDKGVGKKNKMSSPSTGQSPNQLSISPNPSDGQIKVKYHLEETQDVQLQLFSSEGMFLQQWQFTEQYAGSQSQDLNLDNHSAGSYYLTLKTAKNTVIQKVILLK